MSPAPTSRTYVYTAARLFWVTALALCAACTQEPTGPSRGDAGVPGEAQDAGPCLGQRCAASDGGEQNADAVAPGFGGDVGVDSGPICPTEQACGALCCTPGELCLSGRCVTPGDVCEHNVQCAEGDVCEVTLGRCIPRPDEVCEYRPGEDIFDPVVLTAWRDGQSTPAPSYHQVMMTPVVVDLNEDGIPDIAFSTFQGGAYNSESVLRAVNGRTLEPLFDLLELEKRVSGSASLAAGDIDNDGRVELVGVRPEGRGLVAFDDHTTNWAVLWETGDFGMAWDGAYLADLDADGRVEVVAANRVFDGATGTLLCHSPEAGDTPMNAVVVDLDGDGRMEVVASQGAFRFASDGQGGHQCPLLWRFEHGGGFPAVGDFGTFTQGQRQFGVRDGLPEIVTVNTGASDQVQLVDGLTGLRIWSASMPTAGHPHFSEAQCGGRAGGGPPTVADFDGNAEPDVATAGSCYYVVFTTRGELLWKHPTQDFSSRVTGSSVFDFQGDGRAEVVYGDECFLYVLDGAGKGDGTTEVRFRVANTTGTTRELPVVVDVDADFHADIVVISNDYAQSVTTQCQATWEGFDAMGGAGRGVRVVRDRQNRWVSTRPVWNQHAYSVTNVCDGVSRAGCPGRANKAGAIPVGAEPNHRVAHLNNYRQNVQGEGLFDAPDLVLLSLAASCEGASVVIEALVANQGSQGVAAGVPIYVHARQGQETTLVGEVRTRRDLPPGAREQVRLVWADAPALRGTLGTAQLRAVVDEAPDGQRTLNECRTDNNAAEHLASCRCLSNDDCQTGYYCADTGACLPVPG